MKLVVADRQREETLMGRPLNLIWERMPRTRQCFAAACAIGVALALVPLTSSAAQTQPGPDVERLEQAAFKAAVARAADSIVQIQTIGGLDRVEGETLPAGPATGVVVSDDGYIVSSMFHFASRPTSILVRLPDGAQRPAELVGNDESRMLTLLKVETDQPLPAVEAAPMAEIDVGQWAIAVGRSFRADSVNISTGIVSALNRMHGRVLQTDANVSSANYGGPLLDIHGRTIGVLVPMSPSQSANVEGDNAVAGAEFYDSGIGFAVPMEQILKVLPRWIADRDLRRGVLGIGLKKGSPHATAPIIGSVWPSSPASLAGWQPGDQIIAVDDVSVATQSQLRFQLAPRYAGEEVRVRLRRTVGDEPTELDIDVTLAAELGAYRHAFLGVLPMRSSLSKDGDGPDSARTGVSVRAVWPESPAAKAGVQRGDRITTINGEEITGFDDAAVRISAANVSDELLLTVDRNGDLLEMAIEAAAVPDELASRLDLPSAFGDAGDDDPGDLQAQEIQFPDFPQRAWAFDPAPGGQNGLLLWLGTADRAAADSLAGAWEEICVRDRVTLIVASPASEDGWSAADVPFIQRLMRHTTTRYSADPRRTIVAGTGKAGQMACALALEIDAYSGVVSVDGPLPRTLRIPRNQPSRRLSVLAIFAPESPLAVLIRRDVESLREGGYPTVLEPRHANADAIDDLDASTIAMIARWIDALDCL